MSTVLITGCAGYVGSTLVGRLLAAGHKVIGVDKLVYANGHALLPYLGNQMFEFHRVDVRDTGRLGELLWRPDVVIPLAAVVGAPLCERSPTEAAQVNRDAVVHLAGSLSARQRLLYPNTNSGYGQTDGDAFVTEEDPLTPISVYGATKCEAEKAVLDFPNSAVLRLATVFGASPRMRLDLMVNDFTLRLARVKSYLDGEVPLNEPLVIYEGHYKRNFVGVRDVAEAFTFLLTKPSLCGVYNLGLPTANLTKLELAHKVCDVLGIPHRAVTAGEGSDPDQRNYLVSNNKILRAGFAFGHALEQGIREVAQVVDTHTPEQLAQMRNF